MNQEKTKDEINAEIWEFAMTLYGAHQCLSPVSNYPSKLQKLERMMIEAHRHIVELGGKVLDKKDGLGLPVPAIYDLDGQLLPYDSAAHRGHLIFDNL
ncbi:hypothetical protein [Photobacterium sp. 53610]|uniref:hypothetical protein n=1 Tax=Photobacterium sp. 53610 TaxID=3102789 RepID=UPI002EDAD1D1